MNLEEKVCLENVVKKANRTINKSQQMCKTIVVREVQEELRKPLKNFNFIKNGKKLIFEPKYQCFRHITDEVNVPFVCFIEIGDENQKLFEFNLKLKVNLVELNSISRTKKYDVESLNFLSNTNVKDLLNSYFDSFSKEIISAKKQISLKKKELIVKVDKFKEYLESNDSFLSRDNEFNVLSSELEFIEKDIQKATKEVFNAEKKYLEELKKMRAIR